MTTQPGYILETRGLTKHFGQINAVRDLNLSIRYWETYGLLGPNGSGKTTLIRMLVGLVAPTSGEARLFGHSPREARGDIGYMTQSEAIYQELTVRENLEFFAAIYGVASRQRILEMLEFVELSKRADSPTSTLSGGMRRRLSLACALVHRPKLLLLDEPTVGVDPQLRAQFWDHFRKLNQEGVTILVSSHVMDEAERCDRLGLLRDGRLLAEGSPSEIRQRTGVASLEEAFLYFAEA